MISEDAFFAQIEALYVAYDRVPKKGKSEMIYKRVGPVLDDDKQLRAFVEKAVEQETFPSLKLLVEIARQINPKRRQIGRAIKVMECDCGHSFAVFPEDLKRLTGPVPCPGRFYRTCKRLFQPIELQMLFES